MCGSYIDLQQARLVVTDIDGTITTNDGQGFVLPQVGVDAHHEDVIQFFSRVGHNGYQVVYLSARAMALAKNTREYLFEVSLACQQHNISSEKLGH